MSLSPEALEFRKGRMGSSDIAVLTGNSPWKTITTLWHEMVEKVNSDFKDSIPMAMGRELEPLIAKLFHEANGGKIYGDGTTPYVHADYWYMMASPDRLWESPSNTRHLVECKVVTQTTEYKWIDGYPLNYIDQLTWQVGILKSHGGALSDLHYFATLKTARGVFEQHPFLYMEDEFNAEVELAKGFFENYVEPGICPTPRQIEDLREYYNSLRPTLTEVESIYNASEDDMLLLHEFITNKDYLSQLEKNYQEEASVIKDTIKDLEFTLKNRFLLASEIVYAGKTIATYKEDKNGTKIFRPNKKTLYGLL